MKRWLYGGVFLVIVILLSGFTFQLTVTPSVSITGVALSNNTFTCGTAGAVGAISAQGTGNLNGTTFSLSGTDAAQFSVSGNNLTVGASPSGCPRTYTLNIVATLTGASGSPFTQAVSVSGSAVGVATLTINGSGASGQTVSGATMTVAASGGPGAARDFLMVCLTGGACDGGSYASAYLNCTPSPPSIPYPTATPPGGCSFAVPSVPSNQYHLAWQNLDTGSMIKDLPFTVGPSGPPSITAVSVSPNSVGVGNSFSGSLSVTCSAACPGSATYALTTDAAVCPQNNDNLFSTISGNTLASAAAMNTPGTYYACIAVSMTGVQTSPVDFAVAVSVTSVQITGVAVSPASCTITAPATTCNFSGTLTATCSVAPCPGAANFALSGGGALQPLGVAAPPGFQWTQTFDDEFTQDGALDTSKWSLSAANSPVCWYEFANYPPAHMTAGNNCEAYNLATDYPAQGIHVDGTNGLTITPLINGPYPCGGCTPSYDGLINGSGKFAQRFGYWEWSVETPHDTAGEGDGHHSDIFLRVVGATDQVNEIDVTEPEASTTNQTYTYTYVHDGGGAGLALQYPAPGTLAPGRTLASDFHTYGLFWRNDSPHGSVQVYFDGLPQGSPYVLGASAYDAGLYVFLYDQGCSYSQFGGGAFCGGNSSSSNPFKIRYMRSWQLTPTGGGGTPAITVNGSGSGTTVTAGATMTVAFSGGPGAAQNNHSWLGICNAGVTPSAGQCDGAGYNWAYVNTCTQSFGTTTPGSGSCSLTAPSTNNSYTAIWFRDSNYTALASAPFTVTGGGVAGTCTPTGSPCPMGVNAPNGFHWNLTFRDEFTQDSSLNLSVWQRGTCGGGAYQNFDATNGLSIQAGSDGSRCSIFMDPSVLNIRYSYWEWSAQQPPDASGQSDGIHTDIWFRTADADSENDIAEKVQGTGNRPNMQHFMHDYINTKPEIGSTVNYPNPLDGNLDDAFHIYGWWWNNDGSAHGSSSIYFDGALQTGPTALISPSWDLTINHDILAEGCSIAFGGGNTCGPQTNYTASPFRIRYVRVWTLVPG